MTTSANRALETFLLITFPLALFAGCANNGEHKSSDQQAAAQEMFITAQPDEGSSETPLASSTLSLFSDTLNVEKTLNDEDKPQNQDEDMQPDMVAVDTSNNDIDTIDGTTTSVDIDTAMVTSDNLVTDMESTPGSALPDSQDNTMTTDLVSKTIDNESDDNIVKANLQQDTSINASEPELQIINFAMDKTDVADSYMAALEQHARFLKANPGLTLTVSGHTDSRGSADYNEKLSLKRAQEVYNILLSFGAPESQLIVDAYGETSPLHTVDNFNENRRVELQYLDSASLVVSTR
jgi:outer membrane protein OmpA-like peptidoglycan-associated protein